MERQQNLHRSQLVKTVEEGQNNEQCYGTICDVKAQTLPNANNAEWNALFASSQDGNFRVLQLVLRASTFVLGDIAVVNTRSANSLLRIFYLPTVHLVVLLTKEARDAALAESLRQIPRIFTVEINVYGSESDASAVGRELSEAGLFLQHPSYHSDGQHIPYRNPQWLSTVNSCQPGKETAVWSGSQEESSEDTPWLAVEDILNSIPRVKSLGEREVDISLVTARLEKHQKEALDFIYKKEMGEMPLSSRLWSPEYSKSGNFCYRHKITGHSSPNLPDEPGSGLIADEMGLGKSLTMLATIVSTIERARSFSNERSVENPTSPKRYSHATLVIVPFALIIDEWFAEIRRHLAPNSLKAHRYHGSMKDIDHEKLTSFDIVFTTYSTLEADRFRGRAFLGSVKWFRLVLDEAHTIRNLATKQHQAVSLLEAEHKWCLTGTPIQNKIEDLEALVRILQIPLLEQSSLFKWSIIKPTQRKSKDSFTNLSCLLGSMCLRRNKSTVNLPEPTEYWPRVRFSPEEAEADRRMICQFKKHILDANRDGDVARARRLVLRLLLRRRIFCNTGACESLESSDDIGQLDSDERLSLMQQNDKGSCIKCHYDILSVENADGPRSGYFSDCGHLICKRCALNGEMGLDDRSCPICKQKAMAEPKVTKNTTMEMNNSTATPSKILAVIDDILKTKHATKSLVFSCWTKSLDLLSEVAQKHDISFTRLDGNMSIAERRKALASFQKDASIAALFVTIGTGAMGLNVIEASRIHILEPQWNPAMESQAIGRVIRMGQKRGIVIVRYIVDGSIEEHVKSCQQGKIRLATGGFRDRYDSQGQRLQAQLDFATWRSDDSSGMARHSLASISL